MARPYPPAAARWVGGLEGLIFFFLILFAVFLPHSIKGAQQRLEGRSLPVARQAGDRTQATVSAAALRAASGLYRLERNFDRALAPIPT